MNFKKLYGWDADTMSRIEQVIRTTRDSMRHLIFGMRSKSFTEELFIRVTDCSGMTHKNIADSVFYPDRESQIKAYDNLIRHFKLPYCCLVHKEELDPDDFFDDLERIHPPSSGDFFTDEPEGDFFEDEDEWGLDEEELDDPYA